MEIKETHLKGCFTMRPWVFKDDSVDLRRDSSTYGKWFGVELSGENNLQLFIPRGFAHGFSVLSKTALFSYKCDNFYHKASEGGIRYDDPTLGIDWQIPKDKMILSEKDLLLPFFNDLSKG
jgi:dTDP-4-dehydrorhamnose 3,5-epimerase